jgi:hypothetical protein
METRHDRVTITDRARRQKGWMPWRVADLLCIDRYRPLDNVLARSPVPAILALSG